MIVYVINLPSATSRLAHMKRSLDRLDIPFVVIPAIRIEPAITPPPPLTPGEYGCLLSHGLAWRAIADGSDNYGMILEDDVHISERLKNLVLSVVSDNVDLLRFETARNPVVLDKQRIEVGGISIQRLRTPVACSAGYIISRSAARHLLAACENCNEPLDFFLFTPEHWRVKDLRIYQTYPALVVQDSHLREPIDRSAALASEIEPERDIYYRQRRIHSPSWLAKRLLREVTRPFKQLSGRIHELRLKKVYNAERKQVPYLANDL